MQSVYRIEWYWKCDIFAHTALSCLFQLKARIADLEKQLEREVVANKQLTQRLVGWAILISVQSLSVCVCVGGGGVVFEQTTSGDTDLNCVFGME